VTTVGGLQHTLGAAIHQVIKDLTVRGQKIVVDPR
jgi:hypothetical protein